MVYKNQQQDSVKSTVSKGHSLAASTLIIIEEQLWEVWNPDVLFVWNHKVILLKSTFLLWQELKLKKENVI